MNDKRISGPSEGKKEMSSFSHTIEGALLVKQTVIKQTVKGKKKSKHLF